MEVIKLRPKPRWAYYELPREFQGFSKNVRAVAARQKWSPEDAIAFHELLKSLSETEALHHLPLYKRNEEAMAGV